jgi:hypothetical protein
MRVRSITFIIYRKHVSSRILSAIVRRETYAGREFIKRILNTSGIVRARRYARYSQRTTADCSVHYCYDYYYHTRCARTTFTTLAAHTKTRRERKTPTTDRDRHTRAHSVWLAVLWNDNYDDGPYDPMTGLGMGIMTLYPLLTICV